MSDKIDYEISTNATSPATQLLANIFLLEGMDTKSIKDYKDLDEAVSTLTSDSQWYNKVLGQLQRRAYENSFIKVVSPIPKGFGRGLPSGSIMNFTAEYGGEYGMTDGKKNLRVVTFKDEVTFAKGDEKTTSDGVAIKVIYLEAGNKNVLVESDGALKQFEKVDGNAMELINSAQFGSGQLFKDYGKWQSTVDSELDGAIDTMVLKINTTPVKTIDAKLRTDLTLEALQDFEAALRTSKTKHQPNVILRSVMRDLLTITMEQQFIGFTKIKATKRLPKLVLKQGTGAVNTSAAEGMKDIIININIAIGEIGTDTISTNQYFCLASSNVVAGLKSTGMVGPVPAKLSSITRFAGVLKDGTYLIEDGYAPEDYFLVGLRGDERTTIQQPSVVYYPYALEFYNIMSPSTEEMSIGGMMRNVLATNGMDRKEEGNQESLQYCEVDMSGLPNVNIR